MRARVYSTQKGLNKWAIVIKTIAPVFKFPGAFAPPHHKHYERFYIIFSNGILVLKDFSYEMIIQFPFTNQKHN